MRIWGAMGAAVLVIAAGAAMVSSSIADTSGGSTEVTGSVVPSALPATQPAPVSLTVGFRSPPVEGSVRGIERISFGINPEIEFATRWSQRCSLAVLYSSRDPRQECAAALIGEGSVASEITLPGQAPVFVTGKLVAFYAYGRGEPRILAKVTTGEPLPLVYVIPFTIETSSGPNQGTSLVVPRRRMHLIFGKCASEYPNCFAQPYAIEGVYGHISSFTMSLHRVERRHGQQFSFVSGHCSQPQVRSSLLDVSLLYEDTISNGGVHGEGIAGLLPWKCRAR